MKFLIFTDGELLDLAMRLQDEKQDVLMHVYHHQTKTVGDGIVKKVDDWWNCMGQGYIWVFDGCAHGSMQDWLRAKGEAVFGSSEEGDKLENDRQLGQKWFKSAGFYQPVSKNFKSIDDAIKFVTENKDKKWVLKQNGDAPKSLNHIGKFDQSVDMLYHLEELKHSWNEHEYGAFDCDVMEFVEGLEIAASVFFNGKDFLKNKQGKIVGHLNFEDKKEADGQMGETTGEMGTTFFGVTEDNTIFKEILMRPKILEVLRATKFRGVFDINCIKTKDTIIALEPTMRPGVPATSYEFIEALDMPTSEMLSIVAKGESKPISIKQGVGMVMCVVAKPYPIEHDIEEEATSIGEKLWILQNGKPVNDFTSEQRKHIHLSNFKNEEGIYKVATKDGYLLTVTGRGKDIKDTREKLIEYIKSNLYIAGMKYRTDIGQRVENIHTP